MPVAPAQAQEGSGNFLDNLFNRGNQQQPAPMQPVQGQGGPVDAAGDPNDPGVRLGRIENMLRQLTGQIEQLQYRNQQLEMQFKRLQDDTDYRLQQLGSKSGPAGAQPPASQTAPGVPNALTPSGRRSDVFDPTQNPSAPGAPRVLGSADGMPMDGEQPGGAPNARPAGAPLDLSTLSANPQAAPTSNTAPIGAPPTAQQPTTLATLPPSANPKDEYDLAYGYVLHKDYALAEQAFQNFLKKHPNEKLAPDAQYWLGESLYQRQRYRDAAESFLAVSTKYERTGKAPNALLRLGQSLAALNQKEAGCPTLAEVGRKYPKAPASVKRGVAQEIKRAHC
ncbi:MAG: tol-pal system protein YbgF [Pseudolabrys sp.]|nr:tol-pal system protein YbgF [Pseudolabrys sp.]